jgi:tetratricopeptide (TPR) repeat protein
MFRRGQHWFNIGVVAFIIVAVGVAAIGVAAAWWYFRPRPPIAVSLEPKDEGEGAPANPGYLGPQACAECHAERVADFLKTRHAVACVEPSPDRVTRAFDAGPNAHHALNSDATFTMSRSGSGFRMSVARPGDKSEQRGSADIGLVYGSCGAADEMYFTWHGDQLFELPMAWLYPLNCWGSTTLNPHGSGDFGRETGPRCLECHNTWFAYVPGTHNQYRRDDRILGVTCERCHGPGRDHVAYHKAHPGASAGQSIVQPKRLERERQIEVCTQCHGNYIKHRTPAFSHRSGEPLDQAFFAVHTTRPEDDHVANQVTYLRKSKCFQKSDMTCVTCHDPHRPTNVAAVERACLKCHEPANCTDRERQPAAVRNNCAGCHLPPRVWMNVHFHTKDDEYLPPIRRFDHRIAVYPEARKTVLLDWYQKQSDSASKAEAERLRKDLVDYWLAEAERRERDHRLLAKIGALREALRIDATPELRAKLAEAERVIAKLNSLVTEGVHLTGEKKYAEAIASFEEAVRMKPDLPLAHARLGAALLQAGKTGPATEEFRLAIKYDPEDPYPHVMLSKMAFRDEHFSDALASARKADAVEPYSAEIKYLIGQSLLRLNEVGEAEKEFRMAVEIDPRHPGALQSLAHALRKQGKAAEGADFAKRAAKLTNYENADVLLTLADVCFDAGQIPEAEEAATRALAAAQKSDTQLVPIARRRLEEIKTRAK